MTIPVKLPSGMIVDEKTILTHLLHEKTVIAFFFFFYFFY